MPLATALSAIAVVHELLGGGTREVGRSFEQTSNVGKLDIFVQATGLAEGAANLTMGVRSGAIVARKSSGECQQQA